MKPSTPFGGVLVFVGRTHGLHPADDFEAARHEAMMGHVEDLRAKVTPTLHMTDAAEKKKAREKLAASYLPVWAEQVEKQIEDGPFFAGAKLHVVDLELHMAVRWFAGGNVDHIPATIFAGYPKLMRAHDAVRDDSRVKAWYAKT